MTGLNVTITTQKTEEGNVVMVVNPPIPFPDYLQIQMSAIASSMENTLASAPEDIRQAVKDDLYAIFNMAAAAVLDRFDPNPTNHFATTLTEEAILKAENEIIDQKYKDAQRLKKAKPQDFKRKKKNPVGATLIPSAGTGFHPAGILTFPEPEVTE